ncbi:prepilin peptidase [Microbispora bryophytorum]|uniref:Prepilin peptidase n=1 Tax=Microbispora bryophytorum subsp. camponoti TaxID=1677852 RepID=A0ABR8L8D3_9ACTN|nr:A24 family peptidase [Microbispora camponoti]MBD3144759.1 prepilin peptidase [Microbispora camponoti]
MSVVVLAATAVLGLIAGAYARAAAAGFDAEPDDRRENRRESRRGEARGALAAAARTVPLPRPPYAVEGATALAATLVAWRVHDGWVLAAWLYAVVAGSALAEIDRRTWRLPDAITLPSYPIVLALLAPSGRLLPALASGCALGAVYAALWFARPAGLGLGDVKLAGLIGLLTGALGVQATVVAGMAGQVLGALYAVGLLLARRATRTTEFPFGPFMLAGALVAVAFPGALPWAFPGG